MPTHTGSFAIGFRCGKSSWFKDVPAVLNWARGNGFDAIDLNVGSAVDLSAVRAAGLKLGTIDLLDFGNITQSDIGKRKELIAKNITYIREMSAAGAKLFLTIIGADPAKSRGDNYKIAVDSFSPIAEAAAAVGCTLAIEGYPGHAPHHALLCTTPETCRAILKDIPKGLALNFDPSHLIRLGVDHLRFLKEFAGHIVHVHAKDTALFPEAVYEYGLYQPSAFTPPHAFGQNVWRYTVPGRGEARWAEIFSELKSAGYRGLVSVEMEDEDFNSTEAGERIGLIQSLKFLASI